jgi:outer membrane protein assembly factor BamB
VYVDTRRILKAYDATTGTLLWEQDVGEVIGKLALDGSNLYMSCALLDNNCIFSMDLETQTLLWEVDYDTLGVPEIFHLSFDDEVLYGAGDSLVAINAENGDILWQSELVGSLGPPVILDDRVYVKGEGPALYAFDIENGSLEGRLTVEYSLPNRQPRDSEEIGPVVVDDLLIVPLGSNHVYAYRP